MGRRRLQAISLFSGAGGLDFGFEAAGFTTRVALEFDATACATLRHNRKWPVIERDVMDVASEAILATAGLRKGEADVLIGGPPCQPFSKSSYWANGDSARMRDPRSNTLSAYLRILRDTLPKAFLLENVQGLAFSGKDEGLQFLLEELKRINRESKSNYIPSVRVLRAVDFGVPQRRERVFLVAMRDGSEFNFPEPTHRDPETQSNLPVHRTAWDALADVIPDHDEDLRVRGKWAGLLPSIPEGQNYLWHTDRGGGKPIFGWRRRFWSFLLKLAKDQPAWTLQAQPGPATGPFHWENRRLSMREMCRLQTFPDNVVVCGSYQAIQKQIGNAVPSLLAEVLGRSIRSHLLGTKLPRTEPKLLPPARSCPPAEPIQPIPKEFMSLVGDHSAHPGTGQGYAALARLG